jgi:hypothetical protein
MSLCAFALLLLLSFTGPSSLAAEPEVFPDLRPDDRAGLAEAARVLQEEIKLAGRPQTYLLLDLVAGTIHIKGRGVDLHRIPIEHWWLSAYDGTSATFRLVHRPPVARRRIDPAGNSEQEPISLADMPVAYTLTCTPALSLEVLPPAHEHFGLWALSSGRLWWGRLAAWGQQWFGDHASPPHLRLSLSADHARSLAWSMVDGMPLILRRPPP